MRIEFFINGVSHKGGNIPLKDNSGELDLFVRADLVCDEVNRKLENFINKRRESKLPIPTEIYYILPSKANTKCQ